MNYEEELKNGRLEATMESAIPALNIDESKFVATGKDRYLIVFVDMVASTNNLRNIDGNMDEVTRFFKKFHEKTIRSFREKFGNSFKFKMLGDGLLFFFKEDVQLGIEENKRYECRKFHRYLITDLNVRTIAGYGTLIEVDVGLDNNWTDYYGVAINDIVHASKDMGAEFKWIEE